MPKDEMPKENIVSEKKLKVLFCTSTYSGGGGSERVLTVLLNNLPKNWDVDILEVRAFNIKKEALTSQARLLPYLVRDRDRTKFNALLVHVFLHHPRLIKTFRRLYDYEVVIGWMASEGVSILPAFPECKKIAWFHNNIDYLKDYLKESCITSDSNIDQYIGHYRNKRLFNILKDVCDSADALIGVSKMCKASIASVYPNHKNKTFTIYNGTDINEVQAMSREKIGNTELSVLYEKLIREAPLLICVGHICKRKNFSLAVQSLSILRKKGFLCNLVIIGSPSNEADLKDLKDAIQACEVQEHVFLFGYQKNPLPFVARAKLLLMTSLDEGFPTVVTEGMTLGIPFITTPVEGASDELLNEGKCGLLSSWEAIDYASCIERVLKDEELYNAMSKNCKEHVKTYSTENYVGSLQTLLDDIDKKAKPVYKRQNIVLASLLFIFYSAFYAAYKNPRTVYSAKASFDCLKTHFSFLEVAKCCYKIGLYVVNILCFVPLLIYSSVLFIKCRKRIFG